MNSDERTKAGWDAPVAVAERWRQRARRGNAGLESGSERQPQVKAVEVGRKGAGKAEGRRKRTGTCGWVAMAKMDRVTAAKGGTKEGVRMDGRRALGRSEGGSCLTTRWWKKRGAMAMMTVMTTAVGAVAGMDSADSAG